MSVVISNNDMRDTMSCCIFDRKVVFFDPVLRNIKGAGIQFIGKIRGRQKLNKEVFVFIRVFDFHSGNMGGFHFCSKIRCDHCLSQWCFGVNSTIVCKFVVYGRVARIAVIDNKCFSLLAIRPYEGYCFLIKGYATWGSPIDENISCNRDVS